MIEELISRIFSLLEMLQLWFNSVKIIRTSQLVRVHINEIGDTITSVSTLFVNAEALDYHTATVRQMDSHTYARTGYVLFWCPQ